MRGCVIRRVDQLDLGHDLALRGPALRDAPEDRLDRLLLFCAHLLQRRELRVIEVGARQMPEKIADGADLEALEQLRGSAADTGKRRHR